MIDILKNVLTNTKNNTDTRGNIDLILNDIRTTVMGIGNNATLEDINNLSDLQDQLKFYINRIGLQRYTYTPIQGG